MVAHSIGAIEAIGHATFEKPADLYAECLRYVWQTNAARDHVRAVGDMVIFSQKHINPHAEDHVFKNARLGPASKHDRSGVGIYVLKQ